MGGRRGLLAGALRRVAGTGEAEELRARHAAHYRGLAAQAAPGLQGSEQTAWLDRLRGEHDNIRAALGWALARGQAEVSML